MIFKKFRHAMRHSPPSLFGPNPQIRFGWRSVRDESLTSNASQLLSDHLQQVGQAMENVVNAVKDLGAVETTEWERGIY
jgi:hypothetical protein